MNLKNIGKTILNALMAVLRGELLLSLRADKYLIHIIYFFVVAWLTIFTYMKIDQTMLRLERNKVILEELQISHTEKTLELASFNRMSTVAEMLEEDGSEVTIPVKPARKIKNR